MHRGRGCALVEDASGAEQPSEDLDLPDLRRAVVGAELPPNMLRCPGVVLGYRP